MRVSTCGQRMREEHLTKCTCSIVGGSLQVVDKLGGGRESRRSPGGGCGGASRGNGGVAPIAAGGPATRCAMSICDWQHSLFARECGLQRECARARECAAAPRPALACSSLRLALRGCQTHLNEAARARRGARNFSAAGCPELAAPPVPPACPNNMLTHCASHHALHPH